MTLENFLCDLERFDKTFNYSQPTKCQDLMLMTKRLEQPITEHCRLIFLVYLVLDMVKWLVSKLIIELYLFITDWIF